MKSITFVIVVILLLPTTTQAISFEDPTPQPEASALPAIAINETAGQCAGILSDDTVNNNWDKYQSGHWYVIETNRGVCKISGEASSYNDEVVQQCCTQLGLEYAQQPTPSTLVTEYDETLTVCVPEKFDEVRQQIQVCFEKDPLEKRSFHTKEVCVYYPRLVVIGSSQVTCSAGFVTGGVDIQRTALNKEAPPAFIAGFNDTHKRATKEDCPDVISGDTGAAFGVPDTTYGVVYKNQFCPLYDSVDPEACCRAFGLTYTGSSDALDTRLDRMNANSTSPALKVDADTNTTQPLENSVNRQTKNANGLSLPLIILLYGLFALAIIFAMVFAYKNMPQPRNIALVIGSIVFLVTSGYVWVNYTSRGNQINPIQETVTIESNVNTQEQTNQTALNDNERKTNVSVSNSNSIVLAEDELTNPTPVRDAQRIKAVRQLQAGLSIMYHDNPVDTERTYSVSAPGGKIIDESILPKEYVQIPKTPFPPDGGCTELQNSFAYQAFTDETKTEECTLSESQRCTWYTLTFCLGGNTQGLSAGPHFADPTGLHE